MLIILDKSFNFTGCNNYYDKNDRIDYMTFSIGDSTFSTSNDLLICHVSAFACPIDGGAGVYFDVPEGFDLEKELDKMLDRSRSIVLIAKRAKLMLIV